MPGGSHRFPPKPKPATRAVRGPMRSAYTLLSPARRDKWLLLGGMGIGLLLGAWGASSFLERDYAQRLALVQTHLSSTYTARLAQCTREQTQAVTARDLATASATLCRSELERLQSRSPGGAVLAPELPFPSPSPSSLAAPPSVSAAPPVAARPPPAISDPPVSVPLPPKPRPRPAGLVQRPVVPSPTSSPPVASPLAPPMSPPAAPISGRAVLLRVGEEASLGGALTARLVAVSRRNTGRLCIVGADGMETVRIPSGKSITTTRQGRSVTLSATVEGSESCRISARVN